jgi:hypothetical protein
MKIIETQIFRVPTTEGAKYIRAEEVYPGILVHPLVAVGDQEINEDSCCGSITHKDSGFNIVTNILEKRFALKAARRLNLLCNHNCERHWLYMHTEWLAYVKALREKLEWAEEWPFA